MNEKIARIGNIVQKNTVLLAIGLCLMPAVEMAAAIEPCTNCFEKRYVYFSANFDYVEYYDKLKELIPRAKAAGYNGIAIASGGSGSFIGITQSSKPIVEARYRDVVALAAQVGIELIPVGGGPETSARMKPELVEAFPVYNQRLVVNQGSAKAPFIEILSNPSFEITQEQSLNLPLDWQLLDNSVTLDGNSGHLGRNAIRFSNSSAAIPMSRLYRQINGLKPFSAYRLSFWAKTYNYNAPIRFQLYNTERSKILFLNTSNGLGWGTGVNGIKNSTPNIMASTQDWRSYNIDFNTLENSSIHFYLGTWANGSLDGHAWFDDFSLQEVGLAQTVRRSSLPIIVKSEDKMKIYTEGTDYTVNVEKLSIPPGSKIQEGDSLMVSWYQSASGMESNWGVPASSCSAAYFDAQKQVAQKIESIFNASKFFIYYDEWRVMNWDPACGDIAAGNYLSNTLKKMVATMRTIKPGYEFITWSDMFDRYHNAVPNYWMVNGSLVNSWDALPPGITVMNWNMQSPAIASNSLKFFSDLGVQQIIAMYYDDTQLSNIEKWLQSLDLAEREGSRNIKGFMYTTWRGNNGYNDLEKVAARIREKAPGRWPQP